MRPLSRFSALAQSLHSIIGVGAVEWDGLGASLLLQLIALYRWDRRMYNGMNSQKFGGPPLMVYRFGSMLTCEPAFFQAVLAPLQRVSDAQRSTLLLMGPSGAGKTFIAETFHKQSPRSARPFVIFDCSQITSAETLGAELFGYASESGYHNSPRQGRVGKARLADGGTLFIDEIGCLPLEQQQKLLRLIERGCFSPLGTGAEHTVDIQIIAATNADLATQVSTRRFREDLFWRLNELVIHIPPLSHHRRDIPDLAMRFLEQSRARLKDSAIQGFTEEALHALMDFDWSRAGNVRGLEQTLARSTMMAPREQVILERSDLVFPRLLSLQEAAPPAQPGFSTACSPPGEGELSLESIVGAIRQHRYGTEAARSLGISHRQLTWRLQKSGLTVRQILGS